MIILLIKKYSSIIFKKNIFIDVFIGSLSEYKFIKLKNFIYLKNA